MLLPEQMAKVLVVGAKGKQEETINLLYQLEAVHLIDFSSEEPGFSIGAPMPVAGEASQRLLKLRAVQKDLEIAPTGGEVAERIEAARIRKEVDDAIMTMEAEISGAAHTRDGLQARVHDLQAQRKSLEAFITIPIELELYRGYKSLQVFVGQVRSDPEAQVAAALKGFEIFKSDDGRSIALFVAKEEAAEAQRILVQNGYTESPIPEGQGLPTEAVMRIDQEMEALGTALGEAKGKIAQLRERHEAFILASEEELSIEVEKAELPLRLGNTAHSFVIDAWIPVKNVDAIVQTLHERMGDHVYVEVLERVPRREHLHPEEAHEGAAKAHVKEEPPTKLKPSKTVGRFSYLTELMSIPKYGEIDPTNILAITFPIFFGLMVGDIGYGLPFMALGFLGMTRTKKQEWRIISTMLFFGGLWATIFGLFLFGEMFGMHFGPQWVVHEGQTLEQVMALFPLGNELSWSSMMGTALPDLGYVSKLQDVKFFLYMCVWIGIAHLLIGFALGLYNERIRHGMKHAFFHKGGWLIILFGGILLLPWLVDLLILSLPVSFTSIEFILAIALILVGVAICYVGEGGQAILEMPELMSNVMSYTRLAAIGMSKAGMAFAFNMIAIEMIAPAGGVMVVAAILVFMAGHLTIFMLAIISAGLHSIRLHYVELYTKFFSGGGLSFNPLRIIRQYTVEK